MSDGGYCVLGVVLSIATLIWMIVLIRGMAKPKLFDNFSDVLTSWRTVRGGAEAFIFFLALGRQLGRGSAGLLAVSTMSAATTIGISLCGTNVEALRVVRDIVNDVLRWFYSARIPPS